MQDIEETVRRRSGHGKGQAAESGPAGSRAGAGRSRRTRKDAAPPPTVEPPPSAPPSAVAPRPAPPPPAADRPPGPPGETPPARFGRTSTNGLGRYGEQVAARRLTEDGLCILDRNWRCSEGELDIVALDGETLAVCEVKTRSERGFQQPSEAIDPVKAERLHRLAERWMALRWGHHFARLVAASGTDPAAVAAGPAWPPPHPPGGVRIDLVAVINRARGAALVEHLRGVI